MTNEQLKGHIKIYRAIPLTVLRVWFEGQDPSGNPISGYSANAEEGVFYVMQLAAADDTWGIVHLVDGEIIRYVTLTDQTILETVHGFIGFFYEEAFFTIGKL